MQYHQIVEFNKKNKQEHNHYLKTLLEKYGNNSHYVPKPKGIFRKKCPLCGGGLTHYAEDPFGLVVSLSIHKLHFYLCRSCEYVYIYGDTVGLI